MKHFNLICRALLSVAILAVVSLLGNLTAGETLIVALLPTFTDFESLKAFTKTWTANSEGVTDVAALTNGAATTMHNLDDMMVLLAQDTHDYKFINTMFYRDTKSTLNIFGRILDWGGNGDFSFVGETDDAEFKEVIIDRIARNVAFMAEGYAISKVLDMQDTGSFDPEAIQVQGAIHRLMRTLAYKTWYGDKTINSLEFPGFTTELIEAGQVYDAQGGFPAIADIKELTVEVRQAWGMVNEFWLHPSSKAVLDNYYIDNGQFAIPNQGNTPDVGYNIPGLVGAELQNNRLQFQTDMWLNRHQVELPTYRDTNNVKVSGKTNEKAPDAPTATAVRSNVIPGSKWKAVDVKDAAGADALVNYRIVACNRFGRSAPSAVVTSDFVMEVGRSVTLTITPAGTGNAAEYFEIFRESFPGSGKYYLTERVKKAATPTTTHADLNEWIPGTTEGIIGDFNAKSATDMSRTYQFLRMLPMVQTKFPVSALYQRKYAGMVEFYGALAVLQPLRFFLVKNLPTPVRAG